MIGFVGGEAPISSRLMTIMSDRSSLGRLQTALDGLFLAVKRWIA